MSDLEKNAQEEATKKHPYNLREKKEKKAAHNVRKVLEELKKG